MPRRSSNGSPRSISKRAKERPCPYHGMKHRSSTGKETGHEPKGQQDVQPGDEIRTLEWGERDDGTAYVRETCAGDLTEFAFDASVHETEITFRPEADYGLADVADRVETAGDDCFITDFAEALELWEVPFSEKVRDTPLVV